jgi:hypothetical protein
MFVVESGKAKAAKKMSWVMAIACLLHGSLGALLTLHTYVRPSRPAAPGFRIFGFPRKRSP